MSEPISDAEWREIEGYLKATPQARIDVNGSVWWTDASGALRGCMHPRLFLDIKREEHEATSDDSQRTD